MTRSSLQLTILILLLSVLTYCAFKAVSLIQDYRIYTILKEDQAEINKVNYGLFNLQIWKREAMAVFQNRVQDFEIAPSAYQEIEIELEKYLNNIYRDYIESGKIFAGVFENAEKSETVNKFFLKLIKENVGEQIQNLHIRRFIPGMAKELAGELKKQEPRIKEVMQSELKKMLQDDSTENYRDPRSAIYAKYNTASLEEANLLLKEKITALAPEIDDKIKTLYALLIMIIIIAGVSYKVLGANLVISVLTLDSIVFLIAGVSLPMIDIEALLNAFRLNVLGTSIGFDYQVIYFQSKSILDVTRTLLEGRGLDLKIVGVLILAFSIIFPFFKLIFSAFYLYSKRLQNNRLVRNLIFYLGKWSMADVFVVAMFMAYIGFQGLVTAQLGDISRNESGFAVETLNRSKLSPGALFFTTYCILSIITGILIHKIAENNNGTTTHEDVL